MTKKQRRYAAEFEVQADIIAYRKKYKNKMAKAEKLEDDAKELIVKANIPGKEGYEAEFLVNSANRLREQADKLRRSCLLIEEQHIPRLIRTLAAIRTPTLTPGDDKGVVLQK